MSIQFELNGSPLTNAVDLADGIDGLTQNANYGELGGGKLVIDDPNASLDIKGWMFLRVLETEATPPTLAAGYIYGRPITRLEGHSLSRKWDCDFVDLNTLLKFRVIYAENGKRPAETDLERVAWLLDSTYMTDLGTFFSAIVDAGFVNLTDNPINFGEADYRGRYPADVLADIAGISGKQFWVYYDETDGPALFYDLATEPVKDAGISISNDDTEIDPSSGIMPPADSSVVTLFRSPEDVNSGVRYEYKGTAIYRQRAATSTEFGVKRDGTYSTDRVGLAATAEDQAEQWLEGHSVEKDTIELEVELRPEDVNKVLAGDRIQVKFEHLPGYDPAVFTRVIQRIVRLDSPPENYIVHLKMSTAVKHDGGGGGDPGGFPQPPVAEHWWEFSGTAEGDDGFFDLTPNSPAFVEGTYNVFVHVKHNLTYAASWRIENLAGTQGWLQNLGDGGATHNMDDGYWAGTFTIDGSGNVVVTLGPLQASGSGHDFTPAGGFTSYKMQAGSASSHHAPGHISEWDGFIDLVGDPDGPQPPLPKQPVENEIPSPSPDGETTVFTTRWPYADGTLRVFVDNLNQTAAVTESDPVTGEFTLAFAPRVDEVIRVWYLGR